MQAIDASLTLASWLRYARPVVQSATQSREGVLVARHRTSKHPSGAVCYRRHRSTKHGAMLTVEHLVAMDLLYPDVVRQALLRGLETVAVRLGCGAIRAIVHAHFHNDLVLAGHAMEAVTYTKLVCPA